jgi:hypothetical protein
MKEKKFNLPVFFGNHSTGIIVTTILILFGLLYFAITKEHMIISGIIFVSIFVSKFLLDVLLDPYINIGDGIYNTKHWIEKEKATSIAFPMTYYDCKYVSLDEIKQEYPELYKKIDDKIISELKYVYTIADYNIETRNLFANLYYEMTDLYNAIDKSINSILDEKNPVVKEHNVQNFLDNINDIVLYIQNISKDIKIIYEKEQEERIKIDNFKNIKSYNQSQNRII